MRESGQARLGAGAFDFWPGFSRARGRRRAGRPQGPGRRPAADPRSPLADAAPGSYRRQPGSRRLGPRSTSCWHRFRWARPGRGAWRGWPQLLQSGCRPRRGLRWRWWWGCSGYEAPRRQQLRLLGRPALQLRAGRHPGRRTPHRPKPRLGPRAAAGRKDWQRRRRRQGEAADGHCPAGDGGSRPPGHRQ